MGLTGTIFKTLTFDGANSKDYGVYITGQAVYNAPKKAVEMVSIPGRNGAFALDKGHFENIEVTYPAGIFAETEEDFAQAVSDFRNYMCSREGYVKLTDDYNSDEYRLAIYKSGLEVSPAQLIAGEFNITFECKPQRYLTSGEELFEIGTWGEVEEYSGDIATFTSDGADALKKCEVTLTPIQSLNGYSSPWVGGAGKNKFDINYTRKNDTGVTSSVSGNTLTIEADGTQTYQGCHFGKATDLIFPAGTYYIKCNVVSIQNAIADTRLGLRNANNTFKSPTISLTTTGQKSITVTTTEACYFSASVTWNSTGTPNKVVISDIMVSTTDSAFEPYENICPISGRASVDTYATGKNLCPISNFERGQLASGTYYATNTRIMTDYIPIEANTDYYMKKRDESDIMMQNVMSKVEEKRRTLNEGE